MRIEDAGPAPDIPAHEAVLHRGEMTMQVRPALLVDADALVFNPLPAEVPHFDRLAQGTEMSQ